MAATPLLHPCAFPPCPFLRKAGVHFASELGEEFNNIFPDRPPVQHNAARLFGVMKNTLKAYNKAVSNYKQSGQHEAGFSEIMDDTAWGGDEDELASDLASGTQDSGAQRLDGSRTATELERIEDKGTDADWNEFFDPAVIKVPGVAKTDLVYLRAWIKHRGGPTFALVCLMQSP